jgi:peptidoglycan/xylan/chitin deacetylase (PgdA/CDA1 family)
LQLATQCVLVDFRSSLQFSSPARRRWRRAYKLAGQSRVPIVGYHEVEEAPSVGWSVSTEDFDVQLDLLAKTGWTVISLRDLYDYVSGKRTSVPDRFVVLTVDDGWLSTKRDVEPRFRAHDFPFTLFVYPNILGVGSHALSWDDVKDMSNSGVDIQGHTMTHPHLERSSQSAMTDERYSAFLRTELAESKSIIEKTTGKPFVFIAYPYGGHDAAVHAAAAGTGYLAGVTSQTTQPDFNVPGTDPYQLRRFVVDSSTTLDRFRRSLGCADLVLKNLSAADEAVIKRNQKMVSATIPSHASLAFESVHIAALNAGLRRITI